MYTYALGQDSGQKPKQDEKETAFAAAERIAGRLGFTEIVRTASSDNFGVADGIDCRGFVAPPEGYNTWGRIHHPVSPTLSPATLHVDIFQTNYYKSMSCFAFAPIVKLEDDIQFVPKHRGYRKSAGK